MTRKPPASDLAAIEARLRAIAQQIEAIEARYWQALRQNRARRWALALLTFSDN